MSEETVVEKSNPKSVRYTYVNAPDYKVVYVNGVYGGSTSKGELRFDFFQEFTSLPDEEIRKVSAEGKILPPESEGIPEEIEFIRESKMGIIITIGFARKLHEWLGSKLSDFEQMEAERALIISQSERGDEDENGDE